MPIYVGNSTVNTAIANSTITVDQTQNFAYATSNRNSIRPSLILDFARSQRVDPRITFTRASSATYFNSLGVLTTATNNVPRIDYDPVTGSCLGLLIEEARTNLLLNSATLSTQSVTTTATTYILSFYGTGTVALSGTYTGSLVGTGAYPVRSTLSFVATAGTLTLTVTGTVSYAQLEAGYMATSYITTTGATATRAVETCIYTPSVAFPTSGTLLTEYLLTATEATGGPFRDVSAIGSDSSNIIVPRTGTSNTIQVADFVSNVLSMSYSSLVSAPVNQTNKFALTYSSSLTSTCSVNGGTIASGTASAFPTMSNIYLSTYRSGQINGYYRKISFYPVVLSNAEITTLTTL